MPLPERTNRSFSSLFLTSQGVSIKPLSKNDLKAFQERFDDARGGEVVSLQMLTPISFKIALTVQDKNRAFDWDNLNLEMQCLTDAKLLDDNALRAVDMQEGMNINFTQAGIEIGFGSDEYLSSPLRLCATNLKYEETDFSI